MPAGWSGEAVMRRESEHVNMYTKPGCLARPWYMVHGVHGAWRTMKHDKIRETHNSTRYLVTCTQQHT